MSRFFNVAMLQLSSDLATEDLDARRRAQLAKIDRAIDAALSVDPVVDLFVLPETAVSGYDRRRWEALAETIPGPSSAHLCETACRLGVWLCPGSIIERDDATGRTRNTALLISPSGDIALRYSKVFVPYPFEGSERGGSFPVCEIPGIGRVGMMICADAAIPEVARNLAFNGAEIILNPVCQGIFIGGLRHRVAVTQVRAMENQCYVVAVNQAAPEAMGHSVACDPEGRVLEELEESDSFAVVSLNIDEVRRVREHGSFAVSNQFLKMVRDCQVERGALDECYRRGLENAPVFQTLSGPAPRNAGEIRHA
jgi:deaminated glutathione amidase